MNPRFASHHRDPGTLVSMTSAGLELDQQRMRKLGAASGTPLEALPIEYHSGLSSGLQALPPSEKEVTAVHNGDAAVWDANASSDIVKPPTTPSHKRRRKFWFILALAALALIAVAVAAPLAIKHRSGSRYGYDPWTNAVLVLQDGELTHRMKLHYLHICEQLRW